MNIIMIKRSIFVIINSKNRNYILNERMVNEHTDQHLSMNMNLNNCQLSKLNRFVFFSFKKNIFDKINELVQLHRYVYVDR